MKDGIQKPFFTNKIIRIPTEPHEMTMLQWSNFHQGIADCPDWFRQIQIENEEELFSEIKLWDESNWTEFYISVCRLLACVSPDDVTLNDLVNTPFNSDVQGEGLLAMYSTLIECLRKYTPTEIDRFEWKGDTYVVPKSIVDSFGTKTVGASLSTIESIEALQFSLVLNSKNAQGKHHFEDRKYKTDLALLACLCRKVLKDGAIEQMPLEFMKRRRFIDARIQHFEDVPFNIALDIDFFLSNLSSVSFRIHSYNTLLNLLSLTPKMQNQ